MKIRSLKRVWLLLLWPLGCLTLSPVAQKCFLYPVPVGESSPEFLLKETDDTVITVNNIDFKERGLSTIFLQQHCLVQLAYNEVPETDDKPCPILSTNEEYAHVFIRRLEGGVGVRLAEPQTDEKIQHMHLKDKATLIVRANDSKINVAYDCPGGCFQFKKATIHKNLGENLQGSLLFCGKVQPGAVNKGYFNIIRGSSDWNMNTFVSLESVNDPAWKIFNVTVTLREKKQRYDGDLVVRYNSSSLLLKSRAFAFSSPDLFLRFENTSNMMWAVMCRPEATCPASSGEPSSTAAIPISSSSPSGIPDYIQEGKPVVWWMVVLGVACALLILLLTVIIYRLRKRPSEALVSHNPPTAHCDGNLPDHEYDYFDINQLRLSEAQSQGDQQDRRKSHNSINSIYGWEENDPK